jgi:antirestriction protein ArdC
LSGRFGTHDYAMEELVAELGAAYLCAEFFVLHLPRSDHAAYIGEWLEVLKADKRAVFAASAHAMKAVEYLFTA